VNILRPTSRRFALGAAAAVLATTGAVGGLAAPALAAGTCVDQFTGAARTVTLTGTSGNDTLTVTTSNTVVDALEGVDVVRVGPGLTGVAICLGDGADTVTGNGGLPNQPLSVMGGPGNDSITSGSGSDALNGGAGTDFIDAGGGSDTCKNVETAVSCEFIQS